jgi:hypothetical protein
MILFRFFKLVNFVFVFCPESSTSLVSYIVCMISIHLAWVLLPLQFSVFRSV